MSLIPFAPFIGWLSASSGVPRRSPFQRAPAWRLPRPRSENHSSFPSKGGAASDQNPFQAFRATAATPQNIFATLPLPLQAAESSLILRSSIAAAREALPFVRGAFRARIRTCSPLLPHWLEAKLV